MEIDRRKLINVKLEDGSIVPIGNPEEFEMVINEKGEAVIQLKAAPKEIKDETYGL